MARRAERGDIIAGRPYPRVPARKVSIRKNVSCFWRKIGHTITTQDGRGEEKTGRATSARTCLESLRVMQDATARGSRPHHMPKSRVQGVISSMGGKRRRPRSGNWLRLRDALITANIKKVEASVNSMYMKMPMNVDRDDLMGPAITALIERAEHFIPTLGHKFWNYAGARIRGAMKDWMREQDWAPRTDRAKSKQDEDFVIHTQIHLSAYVTENEDLNIFEQLGEVDTRFKQYEDLEWIKKILLRFSKQEQQVIQLCVFEGYSMRECGIRMGLSESRICQLWNQIIDYAKKRRIRDD